MACNDDGSLRKHLPAVCFSAFVAVCCGPGDDIDQDADMVTDSDAVVAPDADLDHNDSAADSDSDAPEATEVSRIVVTDNPFGIHAAGRHSANIIKLGIGAQRFIANAPVWDGLFPDLTSADDPRLDPAMPWALDDMLSGEAGFELVITLRAHSTVWGNGAVNDAIEQDLVSGVGVTGYPDMPDVWLALINKFVERFDGDGIYDHPHLERPIHLWQIENEFLWQWLGDPIDADDAADLRTNQTRSQERLDSYLALLEETAAVIRSQNPSAVIISGAFTGLEGFATRQGFVAAGVEQVDQGHDQTSGECLQNPYGSPPPARSLSYDDFASQRNDPFDEGIQSLISQLSPIVDLFDYHHYANDYRFEQPIMEALNSSIGSNNSEQRLISLENAGPFFHYTIEAQASSIVKRYLAFIEGGGTRLFWSSMIPTMEWGLNFQNLSLLDCEGRPKVPPYYAYRELTARIPVGTTLTRFALSSVPTAMIYQVDPNDGRPPMAFVWERDGETATVFPQDIPAFAETTSIQMAGIITANAGGLSFQDIDPREPLEIDAGVLVLEVRE